MEIERDIEFAAVHSLAGVAFNHWGIQNSISCTVCYPYHCSQKNHRLINDIFSAAWYNEAAATKSEQDLCGDTESNTPQQADGV